MTQIFGLCALVSFLMTASAHQTRSNRFLPLYALSIYDGMVTIEMMPLVLVSQLAVALGLYAFVTDTSSLWVQAGWMLWGLSWLGLLSFSANIMRTPKLLEEHLQSGLGEDYRESIPAERQALLDEPVRWSDGFAPLVLTFPGIDVTSAIPYSDEHPRLKLDIYRPKGTTENDRLPVLLQVHGGAWIVGKRSEQARPLMRLLAKKGWLCVSIGYRLSPFFQFPQHLLDCKSALVWIRENIASYGGDPDFVAVTGESAGGHLSLLLAMTANDPALQPGKESVDTSVQALVPFYAAYDIQQRHSPHHRQVLKRMVQWRIMPGTLDEFPEVWRLASPLEQVRAGLPPTYLIHGEGDELVPIAEGQAFLHALQSVHDNKLVCSFLPGANHAFDVIRSWRTEYTNRAVQRFLEWAYANRSSSQE
ncbi:MAG: alpha/beta hydrolase [Deltaproteobacteria bacterium]|nr:MAG: alpha/beta hydrolase [Deltaproteobacteria bacterium]